MTELYRDAFARRAADLPGASTPGLARLRETALATFCELGLPTTRQEDWRQTDLGGLAERELPPATGPGGAATLPDAAADLEGAIRLVFVDGYLVPELCDAGALPPGARVCGLAGALERDPAAAPGLGSLADPKSDALTALSTALFSDGLMLVLDAGVRLERPVHAIWLASGREVTVLPRLWLQLGEGARALLVEQHLGPSGGSYWTNAVGEALLGPAAELDHVKLQDEAEDAFHTALLAVRQERGSRLGVTSIALGGRLARYDLRTSLDAEQASCALAGLYLGRRRQLIDHHIWVDHAAPDTTSQELFRGILDDRARGVFRGRVHVRPDAQRIDAGQSNRCLMLSDDASVHAQPQLEIYADDVKCSHGNTVGQLDEAALFYLRSRGIPEEAARGMLTVAFAGEVIDELPVEALRDELRRRVQERIP